jgi:hypothetical protein
MRVVTTNFDNTNIELMYDEQLSVLWMSGVRISQVLGTSERNINKHIQRLESLAQFKEGKHTMTVPITRTEGSRTVTRQIRHYSELAVMRIGFRVNSEKALAFQEWAADVLMELRREGVVRLDGQRVLPGGTVRLAKRLATIAAEHTVEHRAEQSLEALEAHALLDRLGVPQLGRVAHRIAYIAGQKDAGLTLPAVKNEAELWLARLAQMVADGTAYFAARNLAASEIPVTDSAPFFIGWLVGDESTGGRPTRRGIYIHLLSASKAVRWGYTNGQLYGWLKEADCLAREGNDRIPVLITLKRTGKRVRGLHIRREKFNCASVPPKSSLLMAGQNKSPDAGGLAFFQLRVSPPKNPPCS